MNIFRNILFNSLLLLLPVFWVPVWGQTTNLQNIEFMQQRDANASAHKLLWKINHSPGASDTSICMMVGNAFFGYVYQLDFDKFYLIDKTIYSEIKFNDLQPFADTAMVIFKHPEPWINRALELNPKSGWAFFLLGYYKYKKFLPEITVDETISPQISGLEKDIAIYFEKSFMYGYRHPLLFRFLGEYYFKNRILNRAKKFLRWNAMERYFDAEAVIQLATIYLRENKAKKALELAFSSLGHLQDGDDNLKYMALRLISNANLTLGNVNRFKYYNQLCRKVIPDQVDAHLDLIRYYLQNGILDTAIIQLKQMFHLNPFEPKSYNLFREIARKGAPVDSLNAILTDIQTEYDDYDPVGAYSWWIKGDLFAMKNELAKAKNAWGKSKFFFRKFKSPSDRVFKEIGKIKR